MATTRRIVCLANSRKLKGRCIAGKTYEGNRIGPWIRPVSGRPTEELSLSEQRLEDGTYPAVLDIIDVPLSEARPAGHQKENWLLDERTPWRKTGRLDYTQVDALLDQSEPLWMGSKTTFWNDYIPLNEARAVADSLRLIRVPSLTISVAWDGLRQKVRVAGTFDYQGHHYRLFVTDPVVEGRFSDEAFGDYEIGACCLTISLGEPLRDKCYKLIAAVIHPDVVGSAGA